MTLRPKTAADVENRTGDLDQDDTVVRIEPTARQLIIAGLNEGDFDSHQEVVEIPIVNPIGDSMRDWYNESEQGGEG